MGATRKVSKVFPTPDSPCKPWTRKNKYKKWVRKLTKKDNGPRRTAAEDLCVGKDTICEGDLGIPRKYMPQFVAAEDVTRFRKFIKQAYRIKSYKKNIKVDDLRPSQKEISRGRIKNLIEDGIFDKLRVPLVVSKDNYIVDGHHRWAAYRLKMPEKALPAIVVDAPIKDVLGIAVAWGAKHHEF